MRAIFVALGLIVLVALLVEFDGNCVNLDELTKASHGSIKLPNSGRLLLSVRNVARKSSERHCVLRQEALTECILGHVSGLPKEGRLTYRLVLNLVGTIAVADVRWTYAAGRYFVESTSRPEGASGFLVDQFGRILGYSLKSHWSAKGKVDGYTIRPDAFETGDGSGTTFDWALMKYTWMKPLTVHRLDPQSLDPLSFFLRFSITPPPSQSPFKSVVVTDKEELTMRFREIRDEKQAAGPGEFTTIVASKHDNPFEMGIVLSNNCSYVPVEVSFSYGIFVARANLQKIAMLAPPDAPDE